MTAACHIAVLRVLSCRLGAMQRRLVSDFGPRTFCDVPESGVAGTRRTRTPPPVVPEATRGGVVGCTGRAPSGQRPASIGLARLDPSRVEGRLASTISTCCSRSSQLWEMRPTRVARARVGIHLAARPRRVGVAVVGRRAPPAGGGLALGLVAAGGAAAVAVKWVAASPESWWVPTLSTTRYGVANEPKAVFGRGQRREDIVGSRDRRRAGRMAFARAHRCRDRRSGWEDAATGWEGTAAAMSRWAAGPAQRTVG